ncbi:DUF6292 family protein [Saccharomonospora piscinae]|uniref:DUF6292 family protein n=1 Tax=Saccharomonospora piscinae TaxID=687388 RepID=UPI000465C287|nr:DUF6292 family protein [Saccharomonospora piscinae]
MDWEMGSTDPMVGGLRTYVRSVVETLGMSGDSSYVQSEPLSLYLAVDGHLPGYPHRDVALLWDERCGWAGALETGCGEDLIVVSYLGDDPLPAPEVVASYTAALLRGDSPGQRTPPDFPTAEVRRGLRLRARSAGLAAGIPEQAGTSAPAAPLVPPQATRGSAPPRPTPMGRAS